MAKIALELERALAHRAAEGGTGHPQSRVLARGKGWMVRDVLCPAGPHDRPFEEEHGPYAVAVVLAGSFQYRSRDRKELMTPGSILLGNPGQSYECGHEHSAGDRCVSFQFEPEYFERAVQSDGEFSALRLPVLRDLSPLVSQACEALSGTARTSWEELGVRFAGQALRLASNVRRGGESVPSSVARVTRIIRRIENDLVDVNLKDLAREAGLSVYHFLRVFDSLTGVTPHQYVLRSRLREAALCLATDHEKILDVAFNCGFGDVSNFNHAFRAEFGLSPRIYRRQSQARR